MKDSLENIKELLRRNEGVWKFGKFARACGTSNFNWSIIGKGKKLI